MKIRENCLVNQFPPLSIFYPQQPINERPKIASSKPLTSEAVVAQNRTLRERGVTLIERPSSTMENEFFLEFNTFR